MSEENAWKEKYLSDTRTTEELIRLALDEDDEDGDVRWEFVRTLHARSSREAFEAAKRLCESSKPKENILGADILAQLGTPDSPYVEESLPLLFNLLSEKQDVDILDSVIVALGHLRDERAVEYLVKFKNYPDEDIRYAVTYSLFGHNNNEAINALIELSRDKDEDVRDWATFGLGQAEADTPEIREALFQRLDEKGSDICDNIGGEALVGLAKRKDERVVEPLLKELESENAGTLILEAAEEFADQRFLPSLLKLKEIWKDYEDEPSLEKMHLEDAIKACQNKNE